MEIVYSVFRYIGNLTVTPAASDLIVPFATILLFLLAIFLVFGAKSLEAKNWLLAFLIVSVVGHIIGLGLWTLGDYFANNNNLPRANELKDFSRYLGIIQWFAYPCLGIFVFLHWRSSEAKNWLLAFLILGVVAFTTGLGLRHLAAQTNLWADFSSHDQIAFRTFYSYSGVIWWFAYSCLWIFVFLHWGSSRMHLNIKNLLFSCSGRIPRSAFWVSLCIFTCLNYQITDGAYEVLLYSLYDWESSPEALLYGLSGREISPIVYPKIAIWVAWAIAHFWIILAISIKRLHDCSKSGYWLFVILIPYLGPLILIGYLGFVRGNDGENQYGDDSLIAQTG